MNDSFLVRFSKLVMDPRNPLPVRAEDGRARKDDDLIWLRQNAESIGLFARGRR